MQKDLERVVSNVLGRRLASWTALSAAELDAVHALTDRPGRSVAAKRELIREGDMPPSAIVVVEGWACRYKMLADGRRQIVAMLLPGDLCDINNHLAGPMDHSIGTLTAARVVEIDADRIASTVEAHPRLAAAFWRQMLVNMAVQREWTLNIGQRSALERIGHLLCECLHRLRAVGMATASGYAFPLTQNDVAEATGLTPVHVNRTLQEMRATGLITLKDRVLHIPDPDRLEEVAQFTPDYLRTGSTVEDGAVPTLRI